MEKPPTETFNIADDVESQCGKCHRTTTHTVVTLEDGKPKRVLCQVCEAEHKYRKPPQAAAAKPEPAKLKKSPVAKKKPAAPPKDAEEARMAEDLAADIFSDDAELFGDLDDGLKPALLDEDEDEPKAKAAKPKAASAKAAKEPKAAREPKAAKAPKEPKAKSKTAKEPKPRVPKEKAPGRARSKSLVKGADGLEDLAKLKSQWEEKVAKHDGGKDVAYKLSGVYEKDQNISHDFFGRGYVIDVIHPNKILVNFRIGDEYRLKTLIMKVREEPGPARPHKERKGKS